MRRYEDITKKIDWITVILFGALVMIGWLNIYAAVYEEGSGKSIFSLDINSGKQFIWILFDVILIVVILLLDFRTYESLAYYIFGFFVFFLLAVLVFGKYQEQDHGSILNYFFFSLPNLPNLPPLLLWPSL